MLFFSPLEQFDSINILPLFIFTLDLSFTSTILPLAIVSFLLILLVLFFKKEFKLVPDF